MRTSAAEWIGRLMTRFKVCPDAMWPNVELSESIQPVTNVDDLLQSRKLDVVIVNLQTVGAKTLFTVPAGKRWQVHFLVKPPYTAAGAVVVVAPNAQVTIVTDKTAAEVVREFVMDQNWILKASSTGNAGDASKDFGIIYSEEDVY